MSLDIENRGIMQRPNMSVRNCNQKLVQKILKLNGILCNSFNLNWLTALVFTFYSVHMLPVLETNWLVKIRLQAHALIHLLDEAKETIF